MLNPRIFPAFIVAFALNAQAGDLEVASGMQKAGAEELALSYMMQHPPAKPDQKWNALEIGLLSKFGRNDQVLNVAKQLPFSGDTALLAVKSAFALKKPVVARDWLAQLIWKGNLTRSGLRQARLDVVKSYLLENDGQDAYYAMLRFDQDYHPVTAAEADTFVAGLLAAKMPKESLPWLIGLDEKNPVRVKAELETGLIGAVDAVRLAGDDPDILLAAAKNDPPLEIRAREAMVASGKLDGKVLWQSYLDHAVEFSNRYALLQGSYGSWPASIAKIPDPYAARSLLAYLSTHEKGSKALTVMIESLQGSPKVAIALFSGNPDLSFEAKKALGKMAFEAGDYASCVKFWNGLPLQQNEPLKLALSLARTNQQAKAEETVKAYLKGAKSLPPAESVLALAAVRSKDLLEALLPLVDAASKREVLMDLGRISADPKEAAAYYFEAASGKKNDPAAILCIESLKQAGFHDDAKALAARLK